MILFVIYTIQNEMDDTRILLEEQNEKNDLLERKFRKVDSELIEVGIYTY